ncbi:Gfo/Idh/MocA family protein [Parasphingorhabdus halotolerans]|uniref:Gfo/Idh/MocA family oxidoreductase n=1 Tax=Parasphingorhabdus halotolerans TaxID=2725558 RepID=A0A6H2DQ10_9SPHN|nr:Gfo/Idh/MocA family oxidoreductase [Parasphingorhabdus halotolerans]QJB69756.1 Gfo/Idh/MocA family oxidoreductase [Parasphingorhabdus halotolerans]
MTNRKIALIGCGGWGKNLARNLHELGALVLIVDPSPNAAELAKSLGVRCSTDLADAIDDPSIDGIAIATPAPTHFAIAERAMLAGKGVFVEKPIALSTKEGERLREISSDTGEVLMVGHLLQYHPVYLRLKELSEAGELGDIKYMASSRLSMGMIRTEENVIWSFSPHDISMVLGIAGTIPERVSAIGTLVLPQKIADNGTIHLVWKNGLRADITSSWLSPQKEQKLVVVGDKAMAVFSDTMPWEEKLTIYRNEVTYVDGRPKAVKGAADMVDVPQAEPLKMEMQHFIDCLAESKSPRTDAAEATRVLAVLQCAESSLENDNKWVKSEDFIAEE